MRVCKVCEKRFLECRRKQGSICDECLSLFEFEYRVSAKVEAIRKLGGKCSKCEYDKNLSALDFHHIEERGEEFNRGMSLTNYKKQFLEKELKKCVLLCKNCHQETHNPQLLIIDKDDKYFGIIKDRKCLNCDKEVVGKVYCSQPCVQMSRRKAKRPTKDELKKLMKENSWCSLGRKYNVSDNAVRKWAKSYGLI